MTKNSNNSEGFIRYGEAKKPFDELNAEELKEVQDRVQKEIRQRAWSVSSPVYYSIKGVIIAEYEDGKKMVVEEVNGAAVETREYEGEA